MAAGDGTSDGVEVPALSVQAPIGCETSKDVARAPDRAASEDGRHSRQSETEHQPCTAEQLPAHHLPAATQQQTAGLEQQLASLTQQLQASRASHEQLQQQVHLGAGLAANLLLDMRKQEADELKQQLKQQRVYWQAEELQLQTDLESSRSSFAAGITRMEQEAAEMAEQLQQGHIQLTNAKETISSLQQTITDLTAASAHMQEELRAAQQHGQQVQPSLPGTAASTPALDIEQLRSMLRREFDRMLPVVVGAPMLTAQAMQVFMHAQLEQSGALP